MSDAKSNGAHLDRRQFFGRLARGALGGAAVIVAGDALLGAGSRRTVWQLDPFKCVQCGQCRTHCVLENSAVKCVHDFAMCGYCEVCTGFLRPGVTKFNEGAENQLCPVGAIVRRFVEEPYFEYTIDETLCTGCGKCVTGCNDYGNGSLYLQVRHDRCLNCNQCSIAAACPSKAYSRVPADRPYWIKHLGPDQFREDSPAGGRAG